MKNKSVYQFLHDYFFEHLGIRKKASEKAIKAYKQSINEFRSYLRDHKKKSFLSLELSDFNKGETKISHRGRKRLRYWLFQGAKSTVAHAEEFKELHDYYTTRSDNPLKKMQSLIVIACKLLRVIYTILRNGTKYDPKKLLSDIKRQEKQTEAAA